MLDSTLQYSRMQIKRDTATNWTQFNPKLLGGEFGYETDTGRFKIGDGSTEWNSLGYINGNPIPLSEATTTGILPINRGGNGNINGEAQMAKKLSVSRTLQTNLSSTTAGGFDGTTNITLGVTGILPIANGGTGASTKEQALINLNAVSKSGGTMTGKLEIQMSNPHFHLKDTNYDTNWYFQAYKDQLAFGPTYEQAVKTDKIGNMIVPGTITVENKVKLDYDTTNECLKFVFI